MLYTKIISYNVNALFIINNFTQFINILGHCTIKLIYHKYLISTIYLVYLLALAVHNILKLERYLLA